MLYKYGMRLRGFSLGCQPMNGFVERQDDTTRKYHDILLYNRQLTEEELKNYELDYLGSDDIEEMAVLGCHRNPQARTAEECAKCVFNQGKCNAHRHAEELYNLGYRKTFTSDLASEKQQAFKEGYERAKEELLESGELVSQEWHDEQILHAENEIEQLKRLNEDLETHSCNDRTVLKALSDELDRKNDENIRLQKIIEKVVCEKCNDNCKIAKAYVKEFAEKLKARITDKEGKQISTLTVKGIELVLTEYLNGND